MRPCFMRTCMLWREWSIAQSHVLCKTYCMMTTSTANRLGGNCWWASTNRKSAKITRAQKGCNTMETASGVLGEYRALVEPYASVFPSRLHKWVHPFQPDKTFNLNRLEILAACLNTELIKSGSKAGTIWLFGLDHIYFGVCKCTLKKCSWTIYIIN